MWFIFVFYILICNHYPLLESVFFQHLIKFFKKKHTSMEEGIQGELVLWRGVRLWREAGAAVDAQIFPTSVGC